jgi:hypothetical protein
MFEDFRESLNKWHTSKNERQKLQHAYLVAAILIVLAAGIVTFFDSKLGHNVVRIALVILAAYAVNAVAWNLLQSSLLDKLTAKPKRR